MPEDIEQYLRAIDLSCDAGSDFQSKGIFGTGLLSAVSLSQEIIRPHRQDTP